MKFLYFFCICLAASACNSQNAPLKTRFKSQTLNTNIGVVNVQLLSSTDSAQNNILVIKEKNDSIVLHSSVFVTEIENIFISSEKCILITRNFNGLGWSISFNAFMKNEGVWEQIAGGVLVFWIESSSRFGPPRPKFTYEIINDGLIKTIIETDSKSRVSQKKVVTKKHSSYFIDYLQKKCSIERTVEEN